MGILVDNVSKNFDDFKAVDQVTVEVKTGSLVALLGPSGSGKSTLLRLIAGLELPDSGKIYLTGRDATYESVQNRKIGFVFQHYALFKHLTIRQNIAFGLEIAKQPKNRIANRVEELIELVQLHGLGNRYPSQLSGGQRQRVALARALALEPQVLLLDEPFGALDAKVRKDLRSWLRNLHNTVRVTTVFVTHDQEEAMEVADELVVMNKGRVEQIGSPEELYDNPATPFVMSFIGPVNVLPSSAPIFKRVGFKPEHPDVFLRPHDVLVELAPTPDTTPAMVSRVIHLGWEIQSELTLEDGQCFTVYLSRDQFNELNLKSGQQVYVKPKDAKSFASQYVEAEVVEA
ncbi:TOBE-like domain-containing protein [Phormidium tenue FACHB-886]|nr:TOBE-like domain-containing protein [Phormidium tenue FACHB-886]